MAEISLAMSTLKPVFLGHNFGSSKGCAPLGPDKGSKGATDEACKNSQKVCNQLRPLGFRSLFSLSHVGEKKTMKYLV